MKLYRPATLSASKKCAPRRFRIALNQGTRDCDSDFREHVNKLIRQIVFMQKHIEAPIFDGKEFFMKNPQYEAFEALNPFFEIVLKGLNGLVDGEHFFETFADDAVFESRYHFPGWPATIRGRANLMESLSGYGKTIKLHSGDALVVHRTQNDRVVIIEYEVHGKVLSSGTAYDNRFISVITIENRRIIDWRDYMDSLAAWTALNRT